MENYQRTKCPSCECPDIAVDTRVCCKRDGWAEPLYLAQCPRCELEFYDKKLSDEQISQIYDNDYFQSEWCWYKKPYAQAWELRKKDFERLQLPLIRAVKQSGKVMELGCAGGATLKAFAETGYETLGVELNEQMAEWGRKNLGLAIVNTDITKETFVSEHDGEFDLIYMSDVLEHVNEPKTLLAALGKLLKPDGFIIVEAPFCEANRFSSKLVKLSRNIFRKRRTSGAKPYHVIFFKPRTLVGLCENAGYKVTALNTWKESILTQDDLSLMSVKGRILNMLDHFLPRLVKISFDDRGLIFLAKKP